MSSKAQLQLFEENDATSLMQQELEAVRKHYEKHWKIILSRHNELAKLCIQLKEENEGIKQRLKALEKIGDGPQPSSNEDLIEILFKEVYLQSSK